MVHQFRGAPAGEHGPGPGPFGLEERTRFLVRAGPLVQPYAVVSAEEVVLVGNVAVERHGHVEH
jgi:hypothetical protein